MRGQFCLEATSPRMVNVPFFPSIMVSPSAFIRGHPQ